MQQTRTVAVSLEGFPKHLQRVLELLLERSREQPVSYVPYVEGHGFDALVRVVGTEIGSARPYLHDSPVLASISVGDHTQDSEPPYQIGRGSLLSQLLPVLDEVVHREGLNQIGIGPVATAQEQPARGDASVSTAFARRPRPRAQVLLVDESFSVRLEAQQLLVGMGLDVVSRPTAEDALVCAQIYDFDLAIIDIGLSDMNGFELCRELRHGRRGRDLAVLMMKGRRGAFDRIRATIAGAAGYLSKPIEADAFCARVELALDSLHHRFVAPQERDAVHEGRY